MNTFKPTQWLVGCKAQSDHWQAVPSTTLRGAKRCATKKYPCEHVQVAQVVGEGLQQRVVVLASKHGYAGWTAIY